MILPKVRDPRFVTIRRGGTLTDPEHHLLALWAASCAEHVLDLFEVAQPDPQGKRVIQPGGRQAGSVKNRSSAHDPALGAGLAAQGGSRSLPQGA